MVTKQCILAFLRVVSIRSERMSSRTPPRIELLADALREDTAFAIEPRVAPRGSCTHQPLCAHRPLCFACGTQQHETIVCFFFVAFNPPFNQSRTALSSIARRTCQVPSLADGQRLLRGGRMVSSRVPCLSGQPSLPRVNSVVCIEGMEPAER